MDVAIHPSHPSPGISRLGISPTQTAQQLVPTHPPTELLDVGYEEEFILYFSVKVRQVSSLARELGSTMTVDCNSEIYGIAPIGWHKAPEGTGLTLLDMADVGGGWGGGWGMGDDT
ncbi:uncharacterized protein H6S33_007305 [Morchella sextelata]|uniref:uncharacterized protein n=1 Tax=Morchella sextelata TaxID=1174677 RepID=UPI001D04F940|nr:uncharacterized protein H6S33_007305 [Morchella sextelata]KAH0603646.1 hypothetical protein H6S33_007305 [Morchella sextelata]